MTRRILRVLGLVLGGAVLLCIIVMSYLRYCATRPLRVAQAICITHSYVMPPPNHLKPPVTVTITDPQTIQEFFALYDSEVVLVTPRDSPFGKVGNLLGRVPEVNFRYGPVAMNHWRFIDANEIDTGNAYIKFRSAKVMNRMNELFESHQ